MTERTADTGRGGSAGHGDAVAYILGALEPAARERFEAHAAGCAECLRELEELGPVADGLALAVAQVDPPPALWQRLLQRAQDVLPAQPVEAAGAPGVAASPAFLPPLPAPPPGAREATSPQVVARRSRWQWAERIAAPLAACALLVAVASGGLAFSERGERQRATADTAFLAETLSIMYQPGRFSRELSADGANPMAKGMVYLTPDGNDAVLVAYNLPRLAAREIYQVWLNNPEVEQRVSAGTFKVDDRGRGQVIVRSPVRLTQFKYCNVTKEQNQGVPKPTGPRVLNGTLAP